MRVAVPSWKTLCAACLMSVLPGPASTTEAGNGTGFHWKNDEPQGRADLLYGEQPVLRYMYAFDDSSPQRREETYKPFHHVFGPGTGEIITKGPGGQYPHHRGLFVGWNRTTAGSERFDFWHCTNGVHQRHARFLKMEGGPQSGTMTAEIRWNAADGRPVIAETRTVTVSAPEDVESPAWQIDWQTTLLSHRGEIVLDGDRQHAGFQFRAAQDVAEKKSARYIRPQGFPDQQQAFQVNDRSDPDAHVDLGWLAMSYPLSDRRYTIEYFASPRMPKPSRYSERPYGRFGAFFKTTLGPAQPLALRYRLIVSTGQPPAQHEVSRRYERFVAELEAAE